MRRPADGRNPGRELSLAMRAALRWLPADGSERHCTDPALAQTLIRLRDRGLCGYRANPRGTAAWRLTAAGQMRRTEIDLLSVYAQQRDD